MSQFPTPTPNPPAGLAAYARVLAGPLAVAALLGSIAAFGLKHPGPKPAPVVTVAEPPTQPEPEPEPPAPMPPPRPAPEPDQEAIAQAQAVLDAARRDHERADQRVLEAADRLKITQQEVVHAIRSSKTLSARLRDPSVRINQARARGKALRAESDRLQGELAAIAEAPRPRARPLVEKTPVARPPSGDEFHFEVRHGRIAYIDLEGLLDRVRTDAKVQIRLADRLGPIGGTVGPEGDFSIHYEMSPDGLDIGDVLSRSPIRASYSLNAWEIIPRSEVRGETLVQALQPGSDFSRAVNTLSPSSASLTLWVYPDSFALYRQLRELLHQRGFLVAARPLPAGVAIRGSPGGSLSASQ